MTIICINEEKIEQFIRLIGAEFIMGKRPEDIIESSKNGLRYIDDEELPKKVSIIDEYDWDEIDDTIAKAGLFEIRDGLRYNHLYGYKSVIEAYKLSKEKLDNNE